MKQRCTICFAQLGKRVWGDLVFCVSCQKSWESVPASGTARIIWAAMRARKCERKRHKDKSPAVIYTRGSK